MNKVLGRWIAVLRMDCGLSRRKLAERLGVAPSMVEQWESESESVPAELVSALADTLHVSPDDLLALQATSRRPRARSIVGQRPLKKRVLPYPVAGTLAEMLALAGPIGWDLSARVEQRLTKPDYERMLQRFPRDSALQLLFTHHLLAAGAAIRRTSLLDLGCGLLVTKRAQRAYDGDRERQALFLAQDDWMLVATPQVPLGVPGCPQIHRADLLALYVDSYGHRQWFDVTIDEVQPEEDPHADCPSLLGLPRLRYGAAQVIDEGFASRFASDIRRFMTSDVMHADGVTTLRVRQPARLEPPGLSDRS